MTEEETRPVEKPPRRRRGFASMDPSMQRAISSKGGRAAHEKGTAHEFTSEEASEAGRRGGAGKHRPREDRDKKTETTPGNASTVGLPSPKRPRR